MHIADTIMISRFMPCRMAHIQAPHGGHPPPLRYMYTRVTTDQENELVTTSTTDKFMYVSSVI
jgi:hypothetical protein